MSPAGTWQAMPQMPHLLQSEGDVTNSGVSVVLPVNDMGPASATPEDFIVSAKPACGAVLDLEDADMQPLIAQPAVLPTSASLGSLNTATLQAASLTAEGADVVFKAEGQALLTTSIQDADSEDASEDLRVFTDAYNPFVQ